MTGYVPQPSKIISELGQIVDGSYYVADGFLSFDENAQSGTNCMFEVAFTQDGVCRAVMYVEDGIQTRLEAEAFNKKILEAKTYLNGKERFTHRKIRVICLPDPRWTKSFSRLQILRAIFACEKYILYTSDDALLQHGGMTFELANLPMMQEYSPEATAYRQREDYETSIQITALQKAIEKAINLKDNGASMEDINRDALAEYTAITQNNYANAPDIYREYIPIGNVNEPLAKLFWLRDEQSRVYKVQPLSALAIMPIYSNDWTSEKIADLMCLLFSFAVGQGVFWNHAYQVGEEKTKVSEIWRSHSFQPYIFNSFTEENGHIYLHGLNNKSLTIAFVTQVIVRFVQRPFDEIDELWDVLENYVRHCTTSRDVHQLSTLLCALTEKLVKIWLENNISNASYPFSSDQRKKLYKATEAAIGTVKQDVFPKYDKEVDGIYEQRYERFMQKVNSLIEMELKKEKLIGNLDQLFGYYGWRPEIEFKLLADYATVKDRIVLFSRSRNSLFHQHVFYADTEIYKETKIIDRGVERDITEHDQEKMKTLEIKNIQMIATMILASFLEYKGRYWDIINNTWADIPS